MKFRVQITETLQHIEEIDDPNITTESEAIEKVKDMYFNEEIVLNSENHTDTEYNIVDENCNIVHSYEKDEKLN